METTSSFVSSGTPATPMVYSRSRRRLILLLVAAISFVLFIVFAVIGLQSQRMSHFILCAILLIATGVSLLFWYIFRNERIETSPDGITYYHPWYCLYSPWSNIAHRTVWPVPRSAVEALQLTQPAALMSIEQGIQKQQPALNFIGRRTMILTDDHTRFIPVGYFMSEWHHSGLADDIRQHAPQVFTGKLTAKHWQLW